MKIFARALKPRGQVVCSTSCFLGDKFLRSWGHLLSHLSRCVKLAFLCQDLTTDIHIPRGLCLPRIFNTWAKGLRKLDRLSSSGAAARYSSWKSGNNSEVPSDTLFEECKKSGYFSKRFLCLTRAPIVLKVGTISNKKEVEKLCGLSPF